MLSPVETEPAFSSIVTLREEQWSAQILSWVELDRGWSDLFLNALSPSNLPSFKICGLAHFRAENLPSFVTSVSEVITSGISKLRWEVSWCICWVVVPPSLLIPPVVLDSFLSSSPCTELDEHHCSCIDWPCTQVCAHLVLKVVISNTCSRCLELFRVSNSTSNGSH